MADGAHGFEFFESPLFYIGGPVVLLAVLGGIGYWVSHYGNPGMSAHVRGRVIHFRRTGRRDQRHDGISD